MMRFPVTPLTASQRASLPQLAKDFRAALSYVSFYSMESPFVTQAVKKLHHELVGYLSKRSPLLFKREGPEIQLNGVSLPESETFAQLLGSHECPGFLLMKDSDFATLVIFLRKAASPSERSTDLKEEMRTNEFLKGVLWADPALYEMQGASEEEAEALPSDVPASSPSVELLTGPSWILDQPVLTPIIAPFPVNTEPVKPDALRFAHMDAELDVHERAELLLELLAEAWQYSQLLKRHKSAHPEADPLDRVFDRLFNRMLSKLEAVSPKFGAIHDWFSTPEGETVEERTVEGMFLLMEAAVKNGWTSVMCDPATEGLVTDCLATWGSTGKHALVERAVEALSESLLRPDERRLAISHLRDSRPWIRNADLLATVLRRLVRMIAGEWDPAMYQTALLLAWDLLEPAIALLKSDPQPVLALLSTLQLHAEDETPSFKDRPNIARHWLYEKTNSEMMRQLVMLAKDADMLRQFSVLGMAAAPLLVKDFYGKTGEEKQRYLELFRDLKEAVQSVVIEILPETQNEEEVRYLLPVIRACGLDPLLAMQLAPWVAMGTRELKMNIIGTIEEMADPAGGPALRLAVLDDDEGIAEAAVLALGKIRFTSAGPLLIKAAQIRRKQHLSQDKFLTAVCRLLGEWSQPESVSFLMETARKKSLLSLSGPSPSTGARLAALHALGNFDSPEVWSFMEQLSQEKNPELQEALSELVQRRTQGI